MKKTLTLTLVLCASFFMTACAQLHSSVKGAVTLDRFAGSNITGVDVSGAFTVTISQGPKTSFQITIPKRFEDKLRLKLESDGTVDVDWDARLINSMADDKFEIKMVCSTLNRVDCSGGVDVNVVGVVTTPELEIDASGAVQIKADNLIVAGQLDVDLSGAVSVELEGSADRCEIDGSGACAIEMAMLKVRQMDIEASGASNIKVWATETLSIALSGTSNVGYKGNPTLHQTISGLAQIKPL